MNEDIARRSINSVKWNAVSNAVQNILSFIQAILLARLLPVEPFGVYAGAAAMIALTASLPHFGMSQAFIHRCEETEDLDKTAAIYFTLQLILNLAWTVLVLGAGYLFLDRTEPGMVLAYTVLTLTFTVKNFASTPRAILNRKIKHQRLAVLQILDVLVTFASAIILALLEQPIWALLATNISNAALQIIIFYLWKPVWRPKFGWSGPTVRYFFRFGSQQVVSAWLSDTLDKGDDFWTKTFLGAGPLGFYSRAYALALIPGNILATPMNQVAPGTFAELKGDRQGLSQAFFETNALLLRTGFILVGGLALVSPEFIRIALGERWLPMLTAFRLMLPFTMFDPMKRTMASLFTAVGKPGIMIKIRTIQLLMMVALLFSLGLPFGIEGVAIAVDVMMVAGIAMILARAKEYVDLSLRPMFLVPTAGLALGLAAGFLAGEIPGIRGNDWFSGFTKGIVFLAVYGSVLWFGERERFLQLLRLSRKYLFKKNGNKKVRLSVEQQ